jgi:hypothetical protein
MSPVVAERKLPSHCYKVVASLCILGALLRCALSTLKKKLSASVMLDQNGSAL